MQGLVTHSGLDFLVTGFPISPFSIHSTNSYIGVCAIQNMLASKISKDIFQPLCIRAHSGIQSVGQVLERTNSLLNHATDLWLRAQKCAISIRATVGVRIFGVEWRAAGNSSRQGTPILAIFPFFMSDSRPLYHGLAAWPSDPALSPSIQATPRSVNKGRHQNPEPRTLESLCSPAERSQKNALQPRKLD